MRRRSVSATSVASLVAVGGVVAFVFWQLRPDLLLAHTTPAGGDMGAHVHGPAYLRDHLLPHGRLTGWTPDWYDGYPALTFYFPLPSMLIVALGVLIPYAIAFKLVTVLGLLTLPVAAWALGRLSGMRDPGPACLAVATLPFLFERVFTIYGGNIPSTLAGEFAFSISLSLSLVFLGVVARGLDTGRHRALAGALLAATALCHLIPTLFALAGAGVLTLMRLDRRRLLWTATAGLAGGAVAGFWFVPFLMRLPYTTDMGWEKLTTYRKNLFPTDLHWVVVLALFGGVASLLMRRRTGVFLSVMAGIAGAGFVLVPQGRLWNARVLPFWFLALYLLAGVGVAELSAVARWMIRAGQVQRATRAGPEGWAEPNGSRDGHEGAALGPSGARALIHPSPEPVGVAERAVGVVTPLAALVAALVFVSLPLQGAAHRVSSDLVSWAGIGTADRSFVPDWVRWNYSGYERKAAYPEYRQVITTMAGIGRSRGCGRAMWEYEPELDRMGTPMALMLLPYWTKGCIASMEGLFFESSATTPYHFLNQSELSASPSRAERALPYGNLNVPGGVAHLQLMGVRYYLAISPQAQAQARSNPDLTLLATTPPTDVAYKTGTEQRTWQIYEVKDSAEVAPLGNLPAVVTGVPRGSKPWLKMSVDWYEDPGRWDVPLAAGGPSQWPHVQLAQAASVPRVPVAPVTVSGIRTTDDRISFDVDRTGSPVLVKASYFPNWHASGARGPWRVTPNLMVVVPTSRHVSLHYGYTPVDGLGWLVTLAGLASLALLARRRPVEYGPAVPDRRPGEDERGAGAPSEGAGPEPQPELVPG
jgi:uncharacterized membrane protein YeaQ/YmgE (transglycosylase-associated protein family)